MKGSIRFPVKCGARNTLTDADGKVLHVQDVVDALNEFAKAPAWKNPPDAPGLWVRRVSQCVLEAWTVQPRWLSPGEPPLTDTLGPWFGPIPEPPEVPE